MGCLTRIGCLVVLVVGGVLAWVFYAGTLPPEIEARLDGVIASVRDVVGGAPGGDSQRDAATSTAPSGAWSEARWQGVDEAGLDRVQDAVAALRRGGGLTRVELEPGELAAFLATAFARQLPASARAAQVAVVDDRVYVKAEVALADFGGPAVLGPFAELLAARDTVLLGATVEPLDAGRMQLRLREVAVRNFGIPSRLLPRLVRTIRRGDMPADLAADAFPLPLPEGIGDVRVARGRVTLYRATSDGTAP